MAISYQFQHFSSYTGKEIYQFLKARQEVFQLEQNIRYLDCDNRDQNAYHLCLWTKQGALDDLVAYLRVLVPAESDYLKVGRVLTRAQYRRQGYGISLINHLLSHCQGVTGRQKLTMAAQAYLKDFYEKFGFQVCSDLFLEEGIEHVTMSLDLSH